MIWLEAPKLRGEALTDLWSVAGDDCDLGYRNLRAGAHEVERELRAEIDALWQRYEPYADPDFVAGFAQDPEARFWEMYLGCRLLEAGKALRPTVERLREGGQPDLCVLDGDRRIWIEAIAPGPGDEGPDQVRGPVPINEGGGLGVFPARQAQLRMTSGLWTKHQAMARYAEQGLFGENDLRMIAVSAGRFGLYASDRPLPTILSALYPFGDQFITLNEAGEVVGGGYEYAPHIGREGGDVPRTAFLDPRFSELAGVAWSRISIGQMSREQRPLSFVHNLSSARPLHDGWGCWDREWKAQFDGPRLSVSDILNAEQQARTA